MDTAKTPTNACKESNCVPVSVCLRSLYRRRVKSTTRVIRVPRETAKALMNAYKEINSEPVSVCLGSWCRRRSTTRVINVPMDTVPKTSRKALSNVRVRALNCIRIWTWRTSVSL